MRRALRFVRGDRVVVPHGQPDVVEAVQQSILREVVELERHVEADCRRGDALVLDVDDDLELGILFDRFPELVDRVLADRREEALRDRLVQRPIERDKADSSEAADLLRDAANAKHLSESL